MKSCDNSKPLWRTSVIAGPFHKDGSAKERSDDKNVSCDSIGTTLDQDQLLNELPTGKRMCVCEVHGLLANELKSIGIAAVFISTIPTLIWPTVATIRRARSRA